MKKELFGNYNGTDIYRYTIDNGILSMSILNWGCVIQKLIFDGVDVECGFDTFDEYAACSDYYGSTIGRYANRIANAKLRLGDKEYSLSVNDFDTNCGHGGKVGFNRHVWNAKEICVGGCEGIEFSRVSPDGEEGFPSNLTVKVTFMLESDTLSIHYEAESDGDTVVNMTNHSYFNIDGFDSGAILEHNLKVNADKLTELDPLRRVTGVRLDTYNTDLDLSDNPKIKQRIDSDHPQLQMIGGYGHNYVIAADAPTVTYRGRSLFEHCVYSSDKRKMTVYSDKPCLQVYTANRIGGHSNFKGNTPVIVRSAVCLEPQFEPDSCNKGRYILHAGEKYDYISLYKFERK